MIKRKLTIEYRDGSTLVTEYSKERVDSADLDPGVESVTVEQRFPSVTISETDCCRWEVGGADLFGYGKFEFPTPAAAIGFSRNHGGQNVDITWSIKTQDGFRAVQKIS